MKTTAIVLAAGSGKRMNSKVPKQFLSLNHKPVLYYCLKQFENSFVDDIILVTSEDAISYCRKEIVDRYKITKVRNIITGGAERYHSVINGIKQINQCDYLLIHDGARPFLTEEMLNRLLTGVKQYDACVAAVPVKDTIKIADENGFVSSTPRRNLVWSIQTPQVFSFALIKEAYQKLEQCEQELLSKNIAITDDAMVVEHFMNHKIKLIEGSYQNIKITTPEDLLIAEQFIKSM